MPATPSTKHVSVTVEVDDRAPSIVRRFVGDVLGDHPRRSDVLVAVSELITNVVRHAPAAGQASVTLDAGPERVRISVRQASGPFEQSQLVAADEPHGRGLKIVEAVSDRWGVDDMTGALEVWFEIDQ